MIAAESRSMVPGVHVDLVPVEQLLGAAQRDPPVPGGDVRQSFAQPGHLLLQVSVELEQNLPGLQGVPSALQGLCQTVVPGGEELLVRCWVTRVQQHSACFIWYSAFVAVKWTSTSNEEQEIHTSIWNKNKEYYISEVHIVLSTVSQNTCSPSAVKPVDDVCHSDLDLLGQEVPLRVEALRRFHQSLKHKTINRIHQPINHHRPSDVEVAERGRGLPGLCPGVRPLPPPGPAEPSAAC